MGDPKQIMIIGPKSVGKSTIGNSILGISPNDLEYFVVNGDPNGRIACGSQHLHGFAGDQSVHIVEVPGFFSGGKDTNEGTWQDVVHAFTILNKQVNVFLLVLDPKSYTLGERTVEAFLGYFGRQAAVNTLVAFVCKDEDKDNISKRYVDVWHCEYLLRLLWHVPNVLVKNMKDQREELLEGVCSVSRERPYKLEDFQPIQYDFTKSWIKNRKKNLALYKQRRGKYAFKVYGIPDIVFQRILNTSMKNELQSLTES